MTTKRTLLILAVGIGSHNDGIKLPTRPACFGGIYGEDYPSVIEGINRRIRFGEHPEKL